MTGVGHTSLSSANLNPGGGKSQSRAHTRAKSRSLRPRVLSSLPKRPGYTRLHSALCTLHSAQVGELKEKPERPFPTFLQPLSNALRVFKRDKPRERWRPVGRPPLALSSQLEANGLAFGGAVFDKPLATVVEQRPLQRPTPPRQQVQRRRWCCPELGWSTASAIFSSW